MKFYTLLDIPPSVDIELEELHEYFSSHKIYLSEDNSVFIGNKLWKTRCLITLIQISIAATSDATLFPYVNFINQLLDIVELKIEKFVVNDFNIVRLADAVALEATGYLNDIERQYSAVLSVK